MKLRIKEAMDSSIPAWLRKKLTKKVVPSAMLSKVDLANTQYHPMSIPRTAQEFNKIRKDPNQVTVVHLRDEQNKEFVWLVGYNDSSYFAPSGTWKDDKPISRHAAKNLIPCIIDYGYLDIAPDELYKLRKSRQSNKPEDRRKHAQYKRVSHEPDYKLGYDEEGNWGRIYQQGPSMQTWETTGGYDKSGYEITGIEKYKEMLASIGFKNYDKVMNDMYDAYTALTGIVRLCRGSKYKMKSYKTLSDRFMRYLADIEQNYAEYTKPSDGEYAEYANRQKERFIRPLIEDDMKKLRAVTKKADEFVRHVTDDDWSEEDYEHFEWKL